MWKYGLAIFAITLLSVGIVLEYENRKPKDQEVWLFLRCNQPELLVIVDSNHKIVVTMPLPQPVSKELEDRVEAIPHKFVVRSQRECNMTMRVL